ncbi:MAG: hypothetical protein Q8O67_32630 [Deltaproteobacteria bacterium]|nr:hypothetical protein [Deltaproteobacteria bacterium]
MADASAALQQNTALVAPLSSSSFERAETAVALEPWDHLSPQLQLDISMMGAVLGVLVTLRIFAGRWGPGRRIGHVAVAMCSSAFTAARIRITSPRVRHAQASGVGEQTDATASAVDGEA